MRSPSLALLALLDARDQLALAASMIDLIEESAFRRVAIAAVIGSDSPSSVVSPSPRSPSATRRFHSGSELTLNKADDESRDVAASTLVSLPPSSSLTHPSYLRNELSTHDYADDVVNNVANGSPLASSLGSSSPPSSSLMCRSHLISELALDKADDVSEGTLDVSTECDGDRTVSGGISTDHDSPGVINENRETSDEAQEGVNEARVAINVIDDDRFPLTEIHNEYPATSDEALEGLNEARGAFNSINCDRSPLVESCNDASRVFNDDVVFSDVVDAEREDNEPFVDLDAFEKYTKPEPVADDPKPRRKSLKKRVIGKSTVIAPVDSIGTTADDDYQNLTRSCRRLLKSKLAAWSERCAIMDALHDYIKTRGDAIPTTQLLTDITAMRASIAVQIEDARSAVVRSVCRLIVMIASTLGPTFQDLVVFLLPRLLSRLFVTVKVISSSSDQCIQAILRSCKPIKSIPKLLHGLSDSHAVVRSACVTYLSLVFNQTENPSQLEIYVPQVVSALTAALADADSNVRILARSTFKSFDALFPNRQLSQNMSAQEHKLLRRAGITSENEAPRNNDFSNLLK